MALSSASPSPVPPDIQKRPLGVGTDGPRPSTAPSPRTARIAASQMKLPTAPKGIKHCNEGCCWRWLTHQLLDEMQGLRIGLTESGEESELYTRAQKQVEMDAVDYARLTDEHNSLQNELGSMKTEVPRVKREVQDLRAVIVSKRAQLEELRQETAKLDAAAKGDAAAESAAQEQLAALKQESSSLRTSEAEFSEMLEKVEAVRQEKASEVRKLLKEKAEFQQIVALWEHKRNKKKGKKKGKSKSP
eukprot:gnl/MRDRNA2_/MRDRNA2_91031_c0_seq1.p1 gnl/MRDRNA2_/MRDRNA2_91031_c0~~gnl/MRDRNA2_/MRDRNA2_91031_c0_seq1.p1  ORF type:complete len:246 (-),score=66.83 gnl/MRDRNA2_/MRDRNA2_91031_c0_seq1:139-876(-)